MRRGAVTGLVATILTVGAGALALSGCSIAEGSAAQPAAAAASSTGASPVAPPTVKPPAHPAPKPTSQAALKPHPKPRPPSRAPALWLVTHIVDGDTVDVARESSVERVRVIGIDTPERGQCGYEAATESMRRLAEGRQVRLVAGAVDDRDRYDRVLRYVDVVGGGTTYDAGYQQIARGMAIARYDSRDGYGFHAREPRYVAKDAATPRGYSCAAPAPSAAQPGPAQPTPATGAQPWNRPGPDLDCSDIGHRVRITGPDYHNLDADGDGWGCDSYG